MTTFRGFEQADLPAGLGLYRGKVRDVLDLGERLVMTATDRISAFDRVLAEVPHKGEVLNRLSLFWFEQTADIIPNHILAELSPRTVVAAKCSVLPVEVVVRGYLTGSAWRDYQKGREIPGIKLPAGLRRYQRFSQPLLTPSTKAPAGEHDEPISAGDIVRRGLVEAGLWARVEKAALALFRRGSEIASARGLILVDTKYEFGLRGGELVLVDELHTPDSSRFWFSEGYQAALAAGSDPRELDKEYFRRWLIERGWSGEGVPPPITTEVLEETSRRYRDIFSLITGEEFVPKAGDAKSETAALLSYIADGSASRIPTREKKASGD